MAIRLYTSEDDNNFISGRRAYPGGESAAEYIGGWLSVSGLQGSDAAKEVAAMKKIDVLDKMQIKQLLYCERVLGIRDDRFGCFNGFQLWWYDRRNNLCGCRESSWLRGVTRVVYYSLDKAAAILWRHRKALFQRQRLLRHDPKVQMLAQLRRTG